MHRTNLAGIDVNLLVTLDALFSETSVTGAARRIGRSQPAVSHALARLREIFDDPLLLRSGHMMVPTERALALAGPLRDALERLEEVVEPSSFVPAACDRTFRIGVDDAAVLYVGPALVAALASAAPSAKVEIISIPPDPMHALSAGRLDALVTPDSPVLQELSTTELFVDDYAVLAAELESPFEGELTAELYASLPHVTVGIHEALEQSLDRQLSSLGIQRQVIARMPDFTSAMMAGAASRALLTAPRRLVELYASAGPVRACPLPFAVESFRVLMAWHRRAERDHAQQWLRERLLESANVGILSVGAVQAWKETAQKLAAGRR